MTPMNYRYCWGPRIHQWPRESALRQLDRKGERCTVLARGSFNSVLVEFVDGEKAVVSRNALRRTGDDRDSLL